MFGGEKINQIRDCYKMSKIKNTLPWERDQTLMDKLIAVIAFTAIKLLLLLPYRTRIKLSGWVFSKILGPVTGRAKVAKEQIQLIFPKKTPEECSVIAEKSLNNTGRSLIENFSPKHFINNPLVEIKGPGFEIIKSAITSRTPVILATGHFGNYEAPRNALLKSGLETGGLYRPMNNKAFNKIYTQAMQESGEPIFPRGNQGTRSMIKHIKEGGRTIILFDQKMREGEVLDFLGQPSKTILSPAELALKFKAYLIPFFGIRNEDGFSFTALFEEPIDHTNSKTMSQQLNDRLSEHICCNPGQWFWIHRRWKN